MRILVVGAGVVGLLTAMECARAGARVDLIEQADIPSTVATSYDRHRVVRALHRGDAPLTRAAARAHHGWLALERRLGRRFYHQVGVLTVMAPDEVPANLALLADAGMVGRPIDTEELAARYPRIRLPVGLAAVLEPAAGVVLADRALAALADWLHRVPVVRWFARRRVVGVDSGAVRLDDGSVLRGDRIVLAAGPWSRDLAPEAIRAKLTLFRQSILVYAPVPARQAWAGTPAIPALPAVGGAWLIPPVADTPVRLSASSACREVAEMTDRVTPPYWRAYLVDLFRGLLADFDPQAVVGATDGYYLADVGGTGPLLALLGDGAVVAYAACGGMTFKLAPLVARVIADRALGFAPRPTGIAGIDVPMLTNAVTVRVTARPTEGATR